MTRRSQQQSSIVSADQYSLAPDINYLNHASIGTVPVVVQRAHEAYLKLCETNPWLYMWSEPWQEPREQVRQQVADLFQCDSNEVAITHNTTEVFNTIASGLPLGPGDEVLFSSLNHSGASICFAHRADEKGYSVRRFDFPVHDVPEMTPEDVVSVYADQIRPSTRVLAIPHIDNMIGLRHPLKMIAKAAHERGVEWVVVDGAQTASMIPLDLAESGVDVYATSAHKWIQSPKGLGLAYVRRDVQDVLSPLWVTWGQTRWKGTARIYEDYGTRALPAVLAMGDALTFQAMIPATERSAHHISMWKEMQEIVDSTSKLEWRSSRNWEAGGALYAVEVVGQPSSDVARHLFEENGSIVRSFQTQGLNTIRISPNIMNSVEDLSQLVSAVL
ncbi:MAG: aminotransferase class V-fold PLP-dependent enzyme [Rhodothermales bacterium]|nr:aminotransferase class V-fold PLP-dependent enzyme [Rhodothermales bacterium]